LASSLKIREGTNGHQYWHVDFDIVATYNGTQLKARIQWIEEVMLRIRGGNRKLTRVDRIQDSTKSGPASVVAELSD
jgi:hypothetical protein